MAQTQANQNPNEVRFIHLRYTNEAGEKQNYGGATIAYRTLSNNPDKIEIALAKCNIKDNFNRKTGRSICLNRLKYNYCWILDKKPINEEMYSSILEFITEKVNHV